MALVSFYTLWEEHVDVFRGYKKRSIAWNGLSWAFLYIILRVFVLTNCAYRFISDFNPRSVKLFVCKKIFNKIVDRVDIWYMPFCTFGKFSEQRIFKKPVVACFFHFMITETKLLFLHKMAGKIFPVEPQYQAITSIRPYHRWVFIDFFITLKNCFDKTKTNSFANDLPVLIIAFLQFARIEKNHILLHKHVTSISYLYILIP